MICKGVVLAAAVTIGVGLIGQDRAAAQVYPSHPVTMGMPFAAGGPGDVLARILAARMQASLGPPRRLLAHPRQLDHPCRQRGRLCATL
jgi:tripartite-type tricarboxylate transporter receptor subunit TctC